MGSKNQETNKNSYEDEDNIENSTDNADDFIDIMEAIEDTTLSETDIIDFNETVKSPGKKLDATVGNKKNNAVWAGKF